jgi:KDO2-lipid IV(A) lauroyltransferase
MPAEEAINSADQQTSLDALNRGVESIVALAPSQYQWEYKRFKARPEGYPPIYPKGS